MIGEITLALLAAAPLTSVLPQRVDEPYEEMRIVGMEEASAWLDIGRALSGSTLNLDLVNAEVEVTATHRDRVEVRVEAAAGGADLSRLRLRYLRTSKALSLTDLFPQRAAWSDRECLPPGSERGDIWAVPGAYRFRVRVPVGVKFLARVQEGGVRDRRPSLATRPVSSR